ncbi:MAG: tRNA (adenosine(37)-N6)-dimethylallyltransferase MiaA [Acidimicrobiales bacterium]
MVLVGPTASGKSDLARWLAAADPGYEIVSADSMALYRGMDIGTAKPTASDRAKVPHHGLDLFEPHEEASLAAWLESVRQALVAIAGRGHRALVVGGTGLYVQALVDGIEVPGTWPEIRAELEAQATGSEALARLHRQLAEADPLAASRMNPTNARRIVRALEVTRGSGRAFSSFGPGLAGYPPSSAPLVGLMPPAQSVSGRLESRLDAQLAEGFIDEVADLRRRPQALSRTAVQALGYSELGEHLDGHLTLDQARSRILERTRMLVKRQRAWFRRDPRIQWVDPSPGAPRGETGSTTRILLGDWQA